MIDNYTTKTLHIQIDKEYFKALKQLDLQEKYENDANVLKLDVECFFYDIIDENSFKNKEHLKRNNEELKEAINNKCNFIEYYI